MLLRHSPSRKISILLWNHPGVDLINSFCFWYQEIPCEKHIFKRSRAVPCMWSLKMFTMWLVIIPSSYFFSLSCLEVFDVTKYLISFFSSFSFLNPLLHESCQHNVCKSRLYNSNSMHSYKRLLSPGAQVVDWWRNQATFMLFIKEIILHNCFGKHLLTNWQLTTKGPQVSHTQPWPLWACGSKWRKWY